MNVAPTNLTQNGLIAEQLLAEQEMRQAGVDRYRRSFNHNKENGRASVTQPWQAYLRGGTAQLSARIDTERNAAKRGRAAIKGSIRSLGELDSDSLAVLTLRRAIDTLATGEISFRRLIGAVGADVEAEALFREFNRDHRELFELFSRYARKSGNVEFARKRLIKAARGVRTDWEPWGSTRTHEIGGFLVKCLIEADILCHTKVIQHSSTRKERVVQLREDVEKWVVEYCSRAEGLSPVLLPMVVPPVDWAKGQRGGYLMAETMPAFSLISSRDGALAPASQQPDRAINWGIAQPAIDAVNTIQRTPWKIAKPAFGVAEILLDSGSPRAGFKPGELELPPKPADMETDENVRKAWRISASKAHGQHRKDIQERLKRARSIGMAKRFANNSEIFFPARLDFRARVYPVHAAVTPQGDDFQKGLLQFAKGKPVENDQHVGWLAVHGANLFGVDKVSFQDRIKWIEDHGEEIEANAKDPLRNRLWEEADKPWQFLTWANEWRRLRSEGFGALSFTPCQIDGTCNGLQHLAAVSRDERAGRFVNLVPGDKPSDIYGEVAGVVTKGLQEGPGCPLGDALLQIGITRKETKRGIMTIPYGATRRSVVGYACSALKEKAEKDSRCADLVDQHGLWKLGAHLGGLTWSAIDEVIDGPMRVMAWLREVAGIVAKMEGKNIQWVPPHGITVKQPYSRSTVKRIKLRVSNSIVRVCVGANKAAGAKVNVKRAKNALPPNLIHSLDASHMLSTINRCRQEGLEDYHVCHDCFGTHCTGMDTLMDATRGTFVDMYGDWCPLEGLLDGLREGVSTATFDAFPALPPKGTLNLSQVTDSAYFFS